MRYYRSKVVIVHHSLVVLVKYQSWSGDGCKQQHQSILSCFFLLNRYQAIPQVYSNHSHGHPSGLSIPAGDEAACSCGQIPVLCSGHLTTCFFVLHRDGYSDQQVIISNIHIQKIFGKCITILKNTEICASLFQLLHHIIVFWW